MKMRGNSTDATGPKTLKGHSDERAAHFSKQIGMPTLVIAALAFAVSIWFGVNTLNALPRAMQRIPVNPEAVRSDKRTDSSNYSSLKLYQSCNPIFYKSECLFNVLGPVASVEFPLIFIELLSSKYAERLEVI